MSLSTKLAGLSPQESDKYLAQIWHNFQGTETWQLLMQAISEIMAEAKSLLLDPRTADRARSHAAGQCLALERLLATMKAAANFDPSQAEYIPVEDDYAFDDQQRI